MLIVFCIFVYVQEPVHWYHLDTYTHTVMDVSIILPCFSFEQSLDRMAVSCMDVAKSTKNSYKLDS